MFSRGDASLEERFQEHVKRVTAQILALQQTLCEKDLTDEKELQKKVMRHLSWIDQQLAQSRAEVLEKMEAEDPARAETIRQVDRGVPFLEAAIKGQLYAAKKKREQQDSNSDVSDQK